VKVGDLIKTRNYDAVVPTGTHGIITKVVWKDLVDEDYTIVKVQLMIDPPIVDGNRLNFACMQLKVVSASR
jgi:hypothetical protein